jgi:phosphohistidine phosphatase SixA
MIRRFLASLLALSTAAAAPAQEPRGIAIVGADVLPMAGAQQRLAGQTVLIEGDSIVKVGPSAAVKVPAGFKVVDGKGKVLMPGLVDMHVHLSPEPGRPGDATQRALAVMLAHGVTTARTMAGAPLHPSVRAGIEKGEIVGPRLYAAAPAIHQGNAPGANAARIAVVTAKQAGYDLIKSHQIADTEVWAAVQAEAKAQGLPTAGHVANSIGIDRAVAAGQQVEHLDSLVHALLAPGSIERSIEFGQIPPPQVMDAALNASDATYAALAKKLAAGKSWQVPTLALFERLADVTTPTEQLARLDDMRFIPNPAIGQWAAQRQGLIGSGFDAAAGKGLIQLRRKLVAALHKAGVRIMAGSDTPQAFHIWGPGLHREIEALSAAGLGPMAALRSATVVPRDYFRSLPNGGSASGWKAAFGTVTAGARADLILLPSDPSRNLAALKRPLAVVAGGRLYERPALDAMLHKAAADARGVQLAAPLAAPAAAAAAGKGPRSLWVMRHLQKSADGDDPGLTEEGRRNAEKLAALVAADPPAAIYVSTTRRARETAAPLAAKLGIPLKTYDPRNPSGLIDAVRAEKGTVLIVGHSNTVPDIIARLGGTKPEPLTDSDYGDVWHITGAEGWTQKKKL